MGGRDLHQSRNFGEEWDLSRFVRALETMKVKKQEGIPFNRFQDILGELMKWREVRNGYSHLGHSGTPKKDQGQNKEDDEDLERRIAEATYLIPMINSMKWGSKERKKLERRLVELAERLGIEQESSSDVYLARIGGGLISRMMGILLITVMSDDLMRRLLRLTTISYFGRWSNLN